MLYHVLCSRPSRTVACRRVETYPDEGGLAEVGWQCKPNAVHIVDLPHKPVLAISRRRDYANLWIHHFIRSEELFGHAKEGATPGALYAATHAKEGAPPGANQGHAAHSSNQTCVPTRVITATATATRGTYAF